MFLPRMSPMFGKPNYDFYEEITTDIGYEDVSEEELKVETETGDLSQMAFWYMVVLVIMLTTWLFIFFCLRAISLRQKTRSSQQQSSRVRVPVRRMHDHEAMHEPSIYVNPANLPPPKYEVMAPPSYDEVMSVHYPNYNRSQPITQPLTHALAHSSTDNVNNVTANVTNVTTNVNTVEEDSPPAHTVVTVTTEDRQTSITVRS